LAAIWATTWSSVAMAPLLLVPQLHELDRQARQDAGLFGWRVDALDIGHALLLSLPNRAVWTHG
jgi:hypothetical protein